MISYASALGIAPAKTIIEFTPSLTKEGILHIESDASRVTLKTDGEIGQYIVLDKELAEIKNGEAWVKYKLTLPTELPPGDREGGIIISELLEDTSKENIVYFVPAVRHKFIVRSPYPGKYITGRIFVTNSNTEEPAAFTLALANWGTEKIESTKATLTIKGPTNEEITVLKTEEISLDPGKEGKLMGSWTAENPGTYFVEAIVEYDGKTFQLSQPFNVGNLEIEIENIQVNNFKIGQIAKLDIYLRNKWNQQLKTEGKVDIFKDARLISSFNTVPVEVGALQSGMMEAYWNTEGIEIGEYDISVKASYAGKTSEKTFSSIVSIDQITMRDMASAKVVGTGLKGNSLLIMLIIFLIIGNIILFFYVRKRLNEKKND